jgi:hypothetical protein
MTDANTMREKIHDVMVGSGPVTYGSQVDAAAALFTAEIDARMEEVKRRLLARFDFSCYDWMRGQIHDEIERAFAAPESPKPVVHKLVSGNNGLYVLCDATGHVTSDIRAEEVNCPACLAKMKADKPDADEQFESLLTKYNAIIKERDRYYAATKSANATLVAANAKLVEAYAKNEKYSTLLTYRVFRRHAVADARRVIDMLCEDDASESMADLVSRGQVDGIRAGNS